MITMKKPMAVFLITFIIATALMACSASATFQNTVPTGEKPETVTGSNEVTEIPQDTVLVETVQPETTSTEPTAPLPDKISEVRAIVLEGMSEDDIKGLCATIKRANKELEYSKIYDNLFARLSDENSLVWNCFHETGLVHYGWAYDGSLNMEKIMEEEGLTEDAFYEKYGEEVCRYINQDAEGFAQELEGYQKAVVNQALQSDLQQIIDLARLATQTHNVEHVVNMYHLLHDMDYFLLNYRMDKEMPYIRDTSTISRYYGVLNVYAELECG